MEFLKAPFIYIHGGCNRRAGPSERRHGYHSAGITVCGFTGRGHRHSIAYRSLDTFRTMVNVGATWWAAWPCSDSCGVTSRRDCINFYQLFQYHKFRNFHLGLHAPR